MSGAEPFEIEPVVATYEDWYSTPFGELADRIERGWLEHLLGDLPPRAKLLDIGCGTGHFARALASQARTVVGCDPAGAMLARARERVPVVRAAGEHLPFADGAFDAACVVAVLDFAEDPVAVLREARRVARRVVVVALARTSWLAARRRLAGLRGHPIFSRARYWSRRRILGFARAAGAEPEDQRAALVFPPGARPLARPARRALGARAPPARRARRVPHGR